MFYIKPDLHSFSIALSSLPKHSLGLPPPRLTVEEGEGGAAGFDAHRGGVGAGDGQHLRPALHRDRRHVVLAQWQAQLAARGAKGVGVTARHAALGRERRHATRAGLRGGAGESAGNTQARTHLFNPRL